MGRQDALSEARLYYGDRAYVEKIPGSVNVGECQVGYQTRVAKHVIGHGKSWDDAVEMLRRSQKKR